MTEGNMFGAFTTAPPEFVGGTVTFRRLYIPVSFTVEIHPHPRKVWNWRRTKRELRKIGLIRKGVRR